jgi:hypothetical protein
LVKEDVINDVILVKLVVSELGSKKDNSCPLEDCPYDECGCGGGDQY